LEEHLEEAEPITKTRLWVIEHFRILPTDKKYQDLTDLQAELLFLNFLKSPDESFYKKAYQKKIKEDALELPAEKLKEMGYNEEELKQINMELSQI